MLFSQKPSKNWRVFYENVLTSFPIILSYSINKPFIGLSYIYSRVEYSLTKNLKDFAMSFRLYR